MGRKKETCKRAFCVQPDPLRPGRSFSLAMEPHIDVKQKHLGLQSRSSLAETLRNVSKKSPWSFACSSGGDEPQQRGVLMMCRILKRCLHECGQREAGCERNSEARILELDPAQITRCLRHGMHSNGRRRQAGIHDRGLSRQAPICELRVTQTIQTVEQQL